VVRLGPLLAQPVSQLSQQAGDRSRLLGHSCSPVTFAGLQGEFSLVGANACRHADPELFFPVSPSGPSLDQITQAKAICAGCPVRQQCLAFALDTRQDHGVWEA
jgi:Transcription factor WhiB